VAPSESARELVDAIGAFIGDWNDRGKPLTWTEDADTVIAKPCSEPRH
jgi:hypothetical protein